MTNQWKITKILCKRIDLSFSFLLLDYIEKEYKFLNDIKLFNTELQNQQISKNSLQKIRLNLNDSQIVDTKIYDKFIDTLYHLLANNITQSVTLNINTSNKDIDKVISIFKTI